MNADQHIASGSLTTSELRPWEEHLRAMTAPDETSAIAGAKALAGLQVTTLPEADASAISQALQGAIAHGPHKLGTAAISALLALGLRGDGVAETLIDACQGESLVLRWKAISALGRLHISTPEALGVLCTAMDDPNGNVRRAATKSLGMIAQKSEEAALVLLDTLDDADTDLFRLLRPLFEQSTIHNAKGFITLVKRSKGAMQRQLFSILLKQIELTDRKQARLLLGLIEELMDTQDTGLRCELCRGIKAVHFAGHSVSMMVAGLMALLEDEANPVRNAALDTLSGLPLSPTQALGLLQKFKHAEQEQLLAAMSAVGQVAPSRVTGALFEELVEILRSSPYTCRLRAASTLKKLRAPKVVVAPLAVLLVGASREETSTVRQSIIDLLDRVGVETELYIAGLRESLACDQTDERQRALLALGSLGEKATEAMTEILGCLRCDDTALVNSATLAIASLGPASVEPLLEMLDEPDITIQERAQEALEGVGRDGLRPLLEGLEDAREYRRVDCAFLLAESRLRDEEAVPGLLRALYDENPWVRRCCAEALGHIASKPVEVVPALVLLLGDDAWDVQAAAAEALASFGPAASGHTDQLLTLLESEKPQVRCAAVIALDACSSLEPAVSAPLLDVATQDPTWYVRKLAHEVLSV